MLGAEPESRLPGVGEDFPRRSEEQKNGQNYWH
jgi:hypothetical protein